MKLKIGNFKGPKGDPGPKGPKGSTGEPGQRGSRWISGTAITGTSAAGTIFPGTGIVDAELHDYYINTGTGNVYECTVPGAADVAEWAHVGNIKGPTGATGPAGSIFDINDQKPTYSESTKLENINSGETVETAFGKLKKAISVLIVHYTQKATASILGHVKLSNSAAITAVGEYALDAVEKNASVNGTLANQIASVNNNLTSKSPFDIVLKRDYDYKTASGWRNILQWRDNNVRTGYLSENVKKGGTELHLNNERGDIFVNGNSINSIVNNINNLKTSKIWNVILATQADGTHEIPSLDGTEVLLMLGYVYRVEATMTIPMNIFKTAKGEGGIILFEGLTIEVVDDTHIRVVGLTNNYLFRVFVR